ncbi:MAG: hypothetical protein WCT19_02620, partial [Candidatus Paceibacterota bacterium]
MNFQFLIFKKGSNGIIILNTLVFAAIAIVIITALANASVGVFQYSKRILYREQAFQIAEAGIDYYRWHLAHAPSDFKDGTGVAGPYTHNFTDAEGNVIGQFILEITPPPIGSTVVTIKSTGKIVEDSAVSRIIEVKLAIPSFAKFAIVANQEMRFGGGTEVWGPLHSNGGIHFDGLAHNIVSSAKDKYNDPDHGGGDEMGVHTHIAPWESTLLSPIPDRSDVFIAGRQFPVSAVDFSGLTLDLSDLKTEAIASGRYFATTNKSGYHIVLKTNGTFDLYKVNSVIDADTYTANGNSCSSDQNGQGSDGWGTWTIKTEALLGNYSFPANGVIFTEDDLWIDGQIDGARLTIGAGYFPDSSSKRKSITINHNLLYTHFDGTDSIGLIAQKNITVGMESDNVLTIDAALIAQNGRVGRYYYGTHCDPYNVRQTINLFGMLASYARYGFSYTDSTGYINRNIVYDGNLLYSPPPSF